MTKETLIELLTAAAESEKKGRFSFSERQAAAILVAVEGTLLTINRVTGVAVTGTHALIEGDREKLFVDAASIAAVRLKAGPEGTGFIKG